MRFLVCFFLFLFLLPRLALAETLLIKTATGKTHIFSVDLAITPDQQIEGLMGRKSLPKDYGMLFVNSASEKVTFWMEGTYVPLDMVFIDSKGRIVKIHENAIPLDKTNIRSDFPVLATLEILGGTAKKKGLKVGDTVHHKIFGNMLDTGKANGYKERRSNAGHH